MKIFDVFRKKKQVPAPWEKYYTKEDIEFEIPDITMYEQIKETALKYPDNYAYKYFSTKVTYKKFIEQIDEAAKAWKTLGVKKGTIVTFCMPNTPEVLIALYALNKLGAIGSMFHPLSSENEIKESIEGTQSKFLVMIDMFYDKIKDTINETSVEKVIFVSVADSMKLLLKLGYKLTKGRQFNHYPAQDNFIPWKEFIKNRDKELVIKKGPDIGKNTPAMILRSGGTSGKPKNIVLQNRALLLGAIQEHIVLKRLLPGDNLLAIMPNFHGFGFSVTMHTPLYIGCTSVLIPQFDGKKLDLLLKKTKPACLLGVPTLFEALCNCNNKNNLDFSFLKYVICGGDDLSPSLETRVNNYLKERKATVKISQGYGLSESLAAVCLSQGNMYKSGSIGVPFPGNYMKIIDSGTRKIIQVNI